MQFPKASYEALKKFRKNQKQKAILSNDQVLTKNNKSKFKLKNTFDIYKAITPKNTLGYSQFCNKNETSSNSRNEKSRIISAAFVTAPNSPLVYQAQF